MNPGPYENPGQPSERPIMHFKKSINSHQSWLCADSVLTRSTEPSNCKHCNFNISRFPTLLINVPLKFVSGNKLFQESKSFSNFVGHRSYITPKYSSISDYLNHLCKAVQYVERQTELFVGPAISKIIIW